MFRQPFLALLASHCLALIAFSFGTPAAAQPVEARLQLAGTNRVEMERALRELAPARREGLAFLINNMPDSDIRTLSAAFLLENVNLAYEAWEKSPWHRRITPEMFLNEILPYASLTEKRESWRPRLRQECLPMIESAQSPGTAAQLLNQKLFPQLKVHYSTSRDRADQSPGESILTGKASCTGLAILLVDACRAVGVPARVVGTPLWTNLRGNHTWVEVWDDGWHFLGAAEPDPAGLDRGWFVGDASRAKADVPLHAIYAASFKRSGTIFPLPWQGNDQYIHAENVTMRYTALANPAPTGPRLAVRVLGASGQRIVAEILVTSISDPAFRQTAQSRGETADLNDLATFNLAAGGKYRVTASVDGLSASQEITMDGKPGEQLLSLSLPVAPLSSSLWRFPCPTNEIKQYTARRASAPITIDGVLEEADWKQAPTSPRFVDILTGGPVIHDTRAAVLWDDSYLYVSYQVEEPFVHARYTNHNDLIYQDNDVELFVAGPDAYYELELNAFNTRYEVFFAWNDSFARAQMGGFPEFKDAKLVPFNGVGMTNHPRGGRVGNFSYALPGLRSAVHIDGTLNNDSDRDRGWTVELALPWSSLKWLATDGRALPPKNGDVWRLDFSRFNTYKEAPPAKDSGGWFWTRHGIWDSHIPECFVLVTFSTDSVSSSPVGGCQAPVARP